MGIPLILTDLRLLIASCRNHEGIVKVRVTARERKGQLSEMSCAKCRAERWEMKTSSAALCPLSQGQERAEKDKVKGSLANPFFLAIFRYLAKS